MTRPDKESLRRQMRSMRDALSDADLARHSSLITNRLLTLDGLRRASNVFVYVSHASEVQTHALIERLLALGIGVAVPKIVRDDAAERSHMIAVWLRNYRDLQPGPFGILEPSGDTPLAEPNDVCIAPGLAFSNGGDRLGSGQGYYDRFLAAHAVKMTIGLAFECQIVPHIEHEPHDRLMDFVVTEARKINCQSRRAADC